MWSSMLRLACDTDRHMDEAIEHRLEASRAGFAGLRKDVESREPWPLSPAYGAEPESDWGPKEVLAHVAEMVPYWLGQIEAVIAAPTDAAPFGRVATDPERIDRIGRDRTLPASELFDRIDRAVADAAAAGGRLDQRARARRGTHPRLGEMTIDGIVERFIVDHLEEHVRQLEDILGRGPGVAAAKA
jgi:hypothetical protein